jgi:predicted AlkP superfamily pyrophosphatase or phosphodiesterase
MGSNNAVLEIVKKYKDGGWRERRAPGYDQFKIDCACDIIRQYRPDLFMIHTTNIDSYRHHNGIFNDKVTRGIWETDRWLGQIMEAVKESGNIDNTDLFLVSDHGQMECERTVNPNVFLAEQGLIKTDENGKVTAWDAWCLSNGMSVQVYVRDIKDLSLVCRVNHLLSKLSDEGDCGIGQIFTEEEIRQKEHLGGDFSFVLETDGRTDFGDAWTGPLIKPNKFSDGLHARASHGYLPDKGPQPFLFAKGPAIKEKVVLECRNITDEAPTYAKILGLSLPDAAGVSIDEILR